MVKDYIENNSLPLGNVHKNMAKYVHKIGCVCVCVCVKARKAVCIQAVKVQVLCFERNNN